MKCLRLVFRGWLCGHIWSLYNSVAHTLCQRFGGEDLLNQSVTTH